MTYYVTGFMYSTDKKRVVLIKKINPEWQRGHLNGVGGKIEQGETPEVAMSREFEEETGVGTTPEAWKAFAVINGGQEYKVYFLYTIDDNLTQAKTVEAEKVEIYVVDDLPRNVLHNLRWLIPMSLDSKLSFEHPIEIEEKELEEGHVRSKTAGKSPAIR